MKRSHLVAALVTFALVAVVSRAEEVLLRNEDVLALVRSGVAPAVVVAKIERSACRFDTSVSALQALKAARVPDEVQAAMVRATAPSREETASAAERLLVQLGTYVAESLAYSAEYGVLTEDPVFLGTLAGKVRLGGGKGDVVAIVGIRIQSAKGDTLVESGGRVKNAPAQPSGEAGHFETETLEGQPVTVFHAPVRAGEGGKVVGGVEVVIRKL
jgi:hypothetical protein